MYRVRVNDQKLYVLVMRHMFSPRLRVLAKYDLKVPASHCIALHSFPACRALHSGPSFLTLTTRTRRLTLTLTLSLTLKAHAH